MAKYIVKRVILMICTLLLISLLTFILMHAVPGGPFTSELKLPVAVEAALNAKYNLDDPLPVQYLDYMVDLAHASRQMRGVELGVSPRGTLALMRASQAKALVEGRQFVTPEDIKEVGVPVIAHRLAVSGMAGSSQAQKEAAASLLSSVALPTEDWSR